MTVHGDRGRSTGECHFRANPPEARQHWRFRNGPSGAVRRKQGIFVEESSRGQPIFTGRIARDPCAKLWKCGHRVLRGWLRARSCAHGTKVMGGRPELGVGVHMRTLKSRRTVKTVLSKMQQQERFATCFPLTPVPTLSSDPPSGSKARRVATRAGNAGRPMQR